MATADKTISFTVSAAAAAPAWFNAMADKTWATPVTNTLFSVRPSTLYGNFNSLTDAWTGGYVDQVRKEFGLCANGGHGDYGGNETYVCKLDVAAPAWVRLNNPSSPTGGSSGNSTAQGNYGDGTMRAVHGWNRCQFANGRVWYAGVDGMYSDGSWSTACWSFNRSTLQWVYHGIGIPSPGGGNIDGEGLCSIYEPTSGKIFALQAGASGAGIGMYSLDTNTFAIAQIANNFGSGKPKWGAAGLGYVFAGDTNNGRIGVIDAANPGAGITFRTPTGTFPGEPHGCVFHAPSRALLLWHGNGSSIIKIAIPANPLTGNYVVSTVAAAPGNTVTPSSPPVNGTFSRFNIIQDIGGGRSALVLVNNVNGPVYVYKLPVAGV